MKAKQLLIAGAVLIVVLLVLLMLPAPASAPVPTGPDPLDQSTWQTFESKEFRFSVKYPATWTVAELYNDPIAPRVNFYKSSETRKPPFDHHSRVTQVSFFPQGVPTEGVFGEIATSTVQLNVPHERAYDFVTDDGTPWATIVSPVNPPPMWSPGFMWIEAEIKDLQEQCLRDGVVIEMDACDFYSGDKLSRTGVVNTIDRKVGEEMFKTVRFVRL